MSHFNLSGKISDSDQFHLNQHHNILHLESTIAKMVERYNLSQKRALDTATKVLFNYEKKQKMEMDASHKPPVFIDGLRTSNQEARDRGHQGGGHTGRHGREGGGLALAMPAKVDMTPQTVPSSPMNGPPATAVDNTIMPFLQRHRFPARGFLQNHLHRLKRRHADFDLSGLGEKIGVGVFPPSIGLNLATDWTGTGLFFN